MTLELLPAVDVADGQAVRLVQGEAGTETATATRSTPRCLAGRRAPSGSTWSTSTRRSAAARNRELLAAVVGALDVDVELSGGIRDDASLRRALGDRAAAGSTSAPPRWRTPTGARAAIAEHGDRVAVGLDVRGTTLAARGWTQDGGDLWEVLEPARRATAAPATSSPTSPRTARCAGPNLDLLRDVCARTDRPVVASGGVSSLDDLRALAGLVPLGVEGAIVGKALYAGAFTLPEALAAVAAVSL